MTVFLTFLSITQYLSKKLTLTDQEHCVKSYLKVNFQHVSRQFFKMFSTHFKLENLKHLYSNHNWGYPENCVTSYLRTQYNSETTPFTYGIHLWYEPCWKLCWKLLKTKLNTMNVKKSITLSTCDVTVMKIIDQNVSNLWIKNEIVKVDKVLKMLQSAMILLIHNLFHNTNCYQWLESITFITHTICWKVNLTMLKSFLHRKCLH